MKIRTKNELQDLIQIDRAWRRKELTNIKYLVEKSNDSYRPTLLRSGVLLLYSHWEGFIKNVTKYFFVYLNGLGLKYSFLKNNYRSLGIYNQFEGDFPSKKFSSYLKTTNFLMEGCENENFKLDVDKHIDTKSNLNSEVLSDFLDKIGSETDEFLKNTFVIDSRLVKYRNAIAHGENTSIRIDYIMDEEWYIDLYERINSLMDHFTTVILNFVELEEYKCKKIAGTEVF